MRRWQLTSRDPIVWKPRSRVLRYYPNARLCEDTGYWIEDGNGKVISDRFRGEPVQSSLYSRKYMLDLLIDQVWFSVDIPDWAPLNDT
jgi:hypothetical protein